MDTGLALTLDDLSDPRIAEFLEQHLADMRSVSPPESVHALDLDRLRQPGIWFWSAWSGGPKNTLAGTGALKQIDATHGEIKSMRTALGMRGRGVATAILTHLLQEARRLGWSRVSLETGSQAFFEPARSLYRRHGFEPCGPFEGYQLDPNSVFMTRTL